MLVLLHHCKFLVRTQLGLKEAYGNVRFSLCLNEMGTENYHYPLW